MAATPPALPPSLWAASATSAPSTPPLRDKTEADVVVVGGGFTGLSTALHLAEAGKSVVVVEAGEPGWGASGRNGGQVNPAWHLLPEEVAQRYGRNRAPVVLDMVKRTCDLVFDVIGRHGIACDAERPGFVQGAFGQRGLDLQAAWARQWGELGIAVERYDRKGLAKLIGTDHYHGGMRDPRGGHLQPLSYARGLARAAMAQGARIHGGTRALELHEKGQGWRLVTDGGAVEAQHVVLATNGYTDGLWPGLRKSVIPIATFIAASEPLDAARLKQVLPGRHAVSETRRALHYYKLDRDNRFVIGGRGNFTNTNEPGNADHVKRMAVRLFPALEGVRWDFVWGGLVAMTPDHAPRLFNLGRNVHAGLAFNGRGVAMGTMFGTQIARLVLGEEPDMPVEPLDMVPNHGLRQLGITWFLTSGRVLDRFDRDPARSAA